MNSYIILLWRRQDKTFLTVCCFIFNLTWFDDCSFLFLFTYFNNDSISAISTSPVATVGTGELSPSKFKYETLQISNDLSNFRNFKFPCENLSPLFKTFWRRFWFLTPYLFTRQFSCIQCLPVWTSKKHAKSEQVKALEGFLYRFQGISRLGSAFSFLRCFKLAHIGIQVTSLNRCNKQGIDHRFLSLAYFTWGVKLRESWT